jgi:DNA-directed RNA polymerase subunit N (RpoN/RPB10)
MIYLKCPSCSYIIGNRQIIYEKKLDEIYSNPNIDDDEKMNQKTKLIDSLNIKRYCCRMRIITFKQLTDIIK